MAKPNEGRSRVVIQNVEPELDCGRFPIKRIVDDTVSVQADVFGDGHDEVRARLLVEAGRRSRLAVDRNAVAGKRPLAGRIHRPASRPAIATRLWVRSIISEPGAATSRSA